MAAPIYPVPQGSQPAVAGLSRLVPRPPTPAAGGGTNVTITGVRALATAAGREGTPKIVINAGVRAAATAAGAAGSPKIGLLGVRGSATAAGKVGAVSIVQNVAVVGVRGLATAAGKAGTAVVVGPVFITGVRASATATGTVGGPKVAVTGARAAAAATGRSGSPRVAVTGVRASSTATGKAGVVHFDCPIIGVRALATCLALPGRAGVGASPVFTTATKAPILDGKTRVETSDDSRTLVLMSSGRLRAPVG